MWFRSKRKKSILILAAFATAMVIFGGNSDLRAADPNIIFQSAPLFNEVNFLPGQEVTRWVQAKNITESPRTVAARVSGFSDPDVLGNQLNLTIKQGATVLYAKTLTQFFNDGEIVFSEIAPSATVQYDFSVTFDPATGNAYMLKSLTFDILVGFTDTQPPAGPTINGFTGSSGGGGGAVILASVALGTPTELVTDEQPAPALSMVKTVDKITVMPGDKNIKFTLLVTNTGNGSASNVAIKDTLPAGMTFSDDGSTMKTWELGLLGAGTSRELVYYADVAPDASADKLVNNAEVTADNYPTLSAKASINVLQPQVLGVKLAETGFKLIEFLLLISVLIILLGASRFLKNKIS